MDGGLGARRDAANPSRGARGVIEPLSSRATHTTKPPLPRVPAYITTPGHTRESMAATVGNTTAAKRLLKAGADRTLLNKEGKSAVDLARENGHTAVVELLEA